MGIAAEPLHRLVQTTFEHAGTTPEEARLVADHLVEANLMGHDSHGVIRVRPISKLLRRRQDGHRQGVGSRRMRGALITVDGQRGLGQVWPSRRWTSRSSGRARTASRWSACATPRTWAGSAPGPSRPRPPAWSRCTSSTPRASASRWRRSAAATGGSRSTRSRWACRARARSRSSTTCRPASIAAGKVRVAQQQGRAVPEGA